MFGSWISGQISIRCEPIVFIYLTFRWREEFVESSHFHTNKDIDKLIADTEGTVTSELEGGDRQKAMKRLRVPPLGDKQSPWTTFKVQNLISIVIV